MSFISLYFVLFLVIFNIIYYCIPCRGRKVVLIIGSLFFCTVCSKQAAIWLLFSVILAFLYGKHKKRIKILSSRLGMWIIITLILLPLLVFKYANLLQKLCIDYHNLTFSAAIAPIGISFYTLSLISYVVDVGTDKYKQEEHFSNFLLFAIFFPQIVQGPIARYNKVKDSLLTIHTFNYNEFTHGWQLILWGYFLKFVVADKAGIVVDNVYGNYKELTGLCILIAAILYSIQIYADFMGCVNIALGAAQTFGIRLENNFRQPYFADSIKDFWRRWHITLSTWLKDYIYIPFGGSKKGAFRKCMNILLVFALSGIWHGAGITFMLWGTLQGIYQIVELVIHKNDKKVLKQGFRITITFLLITFSWMIFRAESVTHFLGLVKGMFAVWNPEVLLNGDEYYKMGLSRVQTIPLVIGIVLMFYFDVLHEKGIAIRNFIDSKSIILRWSIYIVGIVFVLIFGTYGPAYAQNQFIYGQF